MYLVWHGTASVEAVCRDGRLLFDPFVPVHGSSVPVVLREFDGFSEILITHGHLDHIASLPDIVRRNPEVCIRCTAAPFHTLQKLGVPERNLICIHPGDEMQLQGFTIRVFPGKHAELSASPAKLHRILHSPARQNLPELLRLHRLCPENGETVFYVLEAEGRTLQLMGSLNLKDDVPYPTDADLLVLPYNGWQDNLPPAIRTIEALRPKHVCLDHYDNTFPPLTEPLDLTPILAKYPGRVQPMLLHRQIEVV